MRDAFAHSLFEAAKACPDIFMVVADISPAASLNNFRNDFPTRVLDVGIAEQTMISLCAGLAIRGFRPFAYTISNFTIYRPFEQVRVDLAYQQLPVTLVGVGGGMSYSALGATHHTIEDIAVLGALPNLTILAPSDPSEVRESVLAITKQNNPVYLRLGKAGEPNLTAEAPEPFVLGTPRLIRKGEKVAFLGYGPILSFAFDAAKLIQERKSVQPAIYSIHTPKPLDADVIKRILTSYDHIVTIEEHVGQGSLAQQIKALAWECQSKARIHTYHLKDEYIHLYGSQNELRTAHGITPARMADSVTPLL